MSSQARSSREEERGISARTLVIASAASATAALVTSQFWQGGTPIAAAITPVIVALVSELLHRPTERIVQRFTTETDALPEAAGAGPPPPRQALRPEPARETPGQGPTGRPGAEATDAKGAGDGVRVDRSRPKRRLRLKPIAVTAALAFVIGATILTLPELIAGGSITGDGRTTLGGGSRDGRDRDDEEGRGTTDEPVEREGEDDRGGGAQRPPADTEPERSPSDSDEESEPPAPAEQQPPPEDEPAPEETPLAPTTPSVPPTEQPAP